MAIRNEAITGFTQFEAFSPVPDTRKKYCLQAPLSWDIGAKGSGWVLTVSEGTEFDISVPRLFEWVLDPHDRRLLPAAAIHDELLIRGHDPAFASSEFRRAAISRGYAKGKAWLLFISTLLWTSMKRNRK